MGVLQSQMATADSATAATITLGTPTAGKTGLLLFSVGAATTANPSIGSATLGGSADHWASQLSAGGAANHAFVSFWADLNCAAGQTSVVVTPAGGSGSGSMLYWVYECNDLPLSGPVIDVSATFDSVGFVSTWTIGPTSATTQASERIFAVGGGNGTGSNVVTTFTGPGSPWANLQQGRWAGDTHTPSGISGYQDVSATGTQSYAVTASSQTTTVDGLIVALKLAPAGGPGLMMAAFP